MLDSYLIKAIHDPDIIMDHELIISHKDENYELPDSIAVLWLGLVSQLAILHGDPIPTLKRMIEYEEKVFKEMSKE
jgi:hypothetical protein